MNNDLTIFNFNFISMCSVLFIISVIIFPLFFQENIITTSYCAAAYLKSKNFQKKVYVLGSTGITQELDKANIQHLPVGVSIF